MLPREQRVRTSADFAYIVKHGLKARSRLMVVHAVLAPHPESGPSRFGFIVSKAVGNSVVRHRVQRRLRHVCAKLSLQRPLWVVCRALPASCTASSDELARAMDKCLDTVESRS